MTACSHTNLPYLLIGALCVQGLAAKAGPRQISVCAKSFQYTKTMYTDCVHLGMYSTVLHSRLK